MKRYIGVMSGTSCDGIDLCLAGISLKNDDLRYRIISTFYKPYPPQLRDEILYLSDDHSVRSSYDHLERILLTHYKLGSVFAAALMEFSGKCGFKFNTVNAIGLHGQTIYHRSGKEGGLNKGVTLQLGESEIAANKTRVPVVYDFRTSDIIRGGEGAPLAPVVDRLIFDKEKKPAAVLNIGGVANVTLLFPGNRVLAFDTGPGNALMDILTRKYSNNKLKYDKCGRFASRGRIIPSILRRWLNHPYFKKKPPKSTGKEVFGTDFLSGTLSGRHSSYDVMRTALQFTVETIYRGIEDAGGGKINKIWVSGGGVHNDLLMNELSTRFNPVPLETIDKKGISSDFKESFIFAVLAHLYMEGKKINLKNITGNRVPTRLGRIIYPA